MSDSRITPQKRLILTVLQEADEPLTAREVYARAVLRRPALAKSTVYRNLEAMAARGDLEQGALENGERFYTSAATHRHYFVCKRCHCRVDLPVCPLEGLERELEAAAGITVTDHVVQLYGYCKRCREKKEEQP